MRILRFPSNCNVESEIESKSSSGKPRGIDLLKQC